MYRRIGKRVMDLALAVPVLVVLTPVGLALGGLIRLKLGGPVLFRQPRPGREGRVFELIKFRTMSNARGADGELLPDEERLTPLGARLRRLSLDELPTLWNVVRGDMSLVGPRPLLVRYLDRYTPEQRHRHDVLPGITGWAQVNGRNAITWEEKFEHDVWYVENVSLRTDLAILFRTMAQVLGKRGISAEGHATMPEFMGADDE
ncbi:MAG: sugar transferase [Deltaproteobacteria bacterium]|nr:sugar transferase [Deltaproteobacteria bacterium]